MVRQFKMVMATSPKQRNFDGKVKSILKIKSNMSFSTQKRATCQSKVAIVYVYIKNFFAISWQNKI
jgi:hypothetical protein